MLKKIHRSRQVGENTYFTTTDRLRYTQGFNIYKNLESANEGLEIKWKKAE